MVHKLSLQLAFVIVSLTTSGPLILPMHFMCPKRDWFATYKSISGGSVLIGNDVTWKIVGLSTIIIKMQDEIIKTLTNVQHILDLKKNLILLAL